MAETAVEPRPRIFDRAAPRDLDARLFAAGVAAITVATFTFLLVQLNGWPPHEDETLPLFVGRQSLGDLFHTVLGKRGGAPLHFLLAWFVAHIGGGLWTMRFLSAFFAVASLPAIAILGKRLAGRGPALAATALAAAELGAALPRHLRPDVQPVPLPRDALLSRAPPSGRQGRRARGSSGPR